MYQVYDWFDSSLWEQSIPYRKKSCPLIDILLRKISLVTFDCVDISCLLLIVWIYHVFSLKKLTFPLHTSTCNVLSKIFYENKLISAHDFFSNVITI